MRIKFEELKSRAKSAFSTGLWSQHSAGPEALIVAVRAQFKMEPPTQDEILAASTTADTAVADKVLEWEKHAHLALDEIEPHQANLFTHLFPGVVPCHPRGRFEAVKTGQDEWDIHFQEPEELAVNDVERGAGQPSYSQVVAMLKDVTAAAKQMAADVAVIHEAEQMLKRIEEAQVLKYEFVSGDELALPSGQLLRRIRAVSGIKALGVSPGDLGGYLERESNLSQSGQAWVTQEARVFGNAQVTENALVCEHAEVSGNARIRGEAKVSGHAQVEANATVSGEARVTDSAWVAGNARIMHGASVSENAKVVGNAVLSNHAQVRGNAFVDENAEIYGNAYVSGNVLVHNNAHVSGHAQLMGNVQAGGNAHVHGNTLLNGDWKVGGDLDRSPEQHMGRLDSLSQLQHHGGPAYTFWKHAQAAIEAHGREHVDWADVQKRTLIESIAQHGQDPNEVADVLCHYSPGAVSEQEQATIRQTVQQLAPELQNQYATQNQDRRREM